MIVDVQGLSKRYDSTDVFDGVNLQVRAGEMLAITGESGVGKSSLLNCLAGLETWNSGRIMVCGQDVGALSANARAHMRRDRIGFVFQAFHVLPQLSVQQNVALPLLLQGRPDAARVQSMLDMMGLSGLEQRLAHQISGGQLQRVAIARALVHKPQLLLADEPTGNLDPATAAQVMRALVAQCRLCDTALVLVTHSGAAAALADRVLQLQAHGLQDDLTHTN